MAKFLVDDETGEEFEIVKHPDVLVDEDGNEYLVLADDEDEDEA